MTQAPERPAQADIQRVHVLPRWEPVGVLLGCILLGVVVGIPLAILGYRHSWAWGYAGVIVLVSGFAAGVIAASVMRLVRRQLRPSHVIVSAIVVYLAANAIYNGLHNHFLRIPDGQYIAGFDTGRSAAQAHADLATATASCRTVATQQGPQPPQSRTATARYVRGCVAGWNYQRAHPLTDPSEPQPVGVEFPTVRIS